MNEGESMKTFLLSVLIVLFYALPASAVSNFDFTFNFGPSLSQSGNIDKLGEPNINTGFGFNYYFQPKHGIGFSYNNESSFEGTSKTPAIRDASISTFDLHYSYRYIKNKFHFIVEPGLGWQTIYDETSDPYWGYYYYDDLTTALILNYKLMVRYIVKEWDPGDGSMSGSFFLGAGIIQTFSFDDDLNGQDISGSRLASIFQIGVGW